MSGDYGVEDGSEVNVGERWALSGVRPMAPEFSTSATELVPLHLRPLHVSFLLSGRADHHLAELFEQVMAVVRSGR